MGSTWVLVCLVVSVWQVRAQVPVPLRPLGYVYNDGAPDASVMFDVFIDVTCTDSKNSWPTILEVADFYGPSRLRLTVHLFPLPYLTNGFPGAKGVHIVGQQTNTNKTFEYITRCFNNHEDLAQSESLALNDRIGKFADLAVDVGVARTTFTERFHNNEDIEGLTRMAWKYGCTRGLSGTPMFLLNDVQVGTMSGLSVAEWKEKINSLL